MCNGCHNVLMMSVNFDNIAISSINVVAYRWIYLSIYLSICQSTYLFINILKK